MEWATYKLEKLNRLENYIKELYQTTDLSSQTLADVMERVDDERAKINKAKL